MDDRKRPRNDTHTQLNQVNVNDITTKDSTLSETDCVETTSSFMAKLAGQASQLQ